MNQMSHDAPYGYCPVCYASGVTRQRCKNGNDTCANGHRYPSGDALVPRGSRSVSGPTFSAHGSMGGAVLALGAMGALAAASAMRRGARSKKMTLEELTLDSRYAIVYFDLVIEDYNIEEDVGNPESDLHAYALALRGDPHGTHNLESKVYKEIEQHLGLKIGNEGHGSDDALICKVYPETVEEVIQCMNVLPESGMQIPTPYGAVEDVRFYPQGADGPYLTWEGASEQVADENVNFEDWLEIHQTRHLLGGILAGNRYLTKRQASLLRRR